MLPTLCAGYLVAFSSIFVSNVYSQSDNCGETSNNEDVVWPWMVAITQKTRGHESHLCNGFLIDRRHVVSSASCFFGKEDFSDLTARIGNKNQDEGEEYEISCITNHPLYNSNEKAGLMQFYNDITILTLSRDVDTPDYAPICLPDDKMIKKNLEGLEATKVAWAAGIRSHNVGKSLKQNSGLLIIPNQDCAKMFSVSMTRFRLQFPDGVSSEMLCAKASTGKSDICLGDGGAPLMYHDEKNKWIAVGITSFGFPCTGKEAPTGYTRVSEYVKWIKEVTENGKGICS